MLDTASNCADSQKEERGASVTKQIDHVRSKIRL